MCIPSVTSSSTSPAATPLTLMPCLALANTFLMYSSTNSSTRLLSTSSPPSGAADGGKCRSIFARAARLALAIR